MPLGRAYLGFGGYDLDIHGPSVYWDEREERVMYRPTPDEWCVHTVRRINLGSAMRAEMRSQGRGWSHASISLLMLPWAAAICPGCGDRRPLDRDALLLDLQARRPLLA